MSIRCPHPDCEDKKDNEYKTNLKRTVHMEDVHRKQRDPIKDPKKLLREIKKLKNKLGAAARSGMAMGNGGSAVVGIINADFDKMSPPQRSKKKKN